MPILDLQRRSQVIGKIRTGYRNADGNPVKSKTFLFTTANLRAAHQIAEAFGGKVRPWAVKPGHYVVASERSEVDVVISPRGEAVSQWNEMWTAAGCARRCDSVTDTISGKPCLCPSDPVERMRLAKLKKPQACKPATRISVVLPDISGMGVWMLVTGSEQAACEIMDAGDLLTMAREQGILLPATLRLEQRETRIVGEPAKQYGVIVLEPHNTFRQIASGELSNATLMAQLPPAPAQRLALTAGLSEPVAPRTPTTPAPGGVPTAQELADRATRATTPAEFKAIGAEMEKHQLDDDLVLIDGAEEELRDYLRHCWRLRAEASAPSGASAHDWDDVETAPIPQ